MDLELVAIALLDLVVITLLYAVIAKDELRRERTATDELWVRSLDDYRERARIRGQHPTPAMTAPADRPVSIPTASDFSTTE